MYPRFGTPFRSGSIGLISSAQVQRRKRRGQRAGGVDKRGDRSYMCIESPVLLEGVLQCWRNRGASLESIRIGGEHLGANDACRAGRRRLFPIRRQRPLPGRCALQRSFWTQPFNEMFEGSLSLAWNMRSFGLLDEATDTDSCYRRRSLQATTHFSAFIEIYMTSFIVLYHFIKVTTSSSLVLVVKNKFGKFQEFWPEWSSEEKS